MNTIEAPKLGPIKGTHGFIFEFKLSRGALVFIRYQEGDREFASSERIFYCFTPEVNIPLIIRLGFKSYCGAGERIINAAIKFIQDNPTAY